MLIEKPFHKLESDTGKIWDKLAQYDSQSLNIPQAKGKWSAIQHMVHLNKSERSFVILLTKALRNNTPLNGNAFKINLRSRFYKIYLNLGFKIKAPKVIEPAPENFELEEVKRDFIKTRAQLRQILETVTPEQLPRFWVHHMYLKELRIKDLVDFLVFHQNHHRKKI